MKKFICLLLAALLVLPVLAACAKEPTPDTVRVFTLKGPTGIGMAKMISDAKAEENPLYNFTIAGAPDVMTYVKINLDPSSLLTMDLKTAKHREVTEE